VRSDCPLCAKSRHCGHIIRLLTASPRHSALHRICERLVDNTSIRSDRQVLAQARGPGVAPPLEPPDTPIPEPKITLPLLRADFPIGKIGTSDGAVDTFLDAVSVFERERVIVYRDPTTDGLQCRLGRHRTTWAFYWDDRRRRRRKIVSKVLGHFPTMRTEEARNAARIERGRVAAGDTSPGKRESVKVETSLAEYIAHLERKSAAKGKPALWAKNVRSLVNKHILPRFGQWSLADIATHPAAVADWHSDITEANGPVVANQSCKVLRAAYRRSTKRDPSLPERDPCSAVEYNREQRSQDALLPADFPKWRKAWEKIESPTRRAYQGIGLLSGMRPGELSRLKWSDVLPRERCFVIRGAKADNDIRVPMSAAIARLFKLARDAKTDSEYVFPARAGGHIVKRDADGLPAWGMMYRRGWRTVAADLGVDELIAHFCLGHIPAGISRGYVSKMILSGGSAMRTAQRKVSRRIVQLLGADPTLGVSISAD
jgi:integrase